MKIAYVSTYSEENEKHSESGGVASYSKNLVESIPLRPEDEIFILCDKTKNRREISVKKNINVIRCFDKNPKFFFQISSEIKKIKPDVVHIQQELALFGNIFTSYFLQWLIFLLRKHKIIVTLHGVVSLKKINKNFIRENYSNLPAWLVKTGFYIIYKPLCVWSDKIIVHEEYFKNILMEEYDADKNKIEVIFHGIEDLKPMDKKDACSELGLNKNKDIILFMGYLTGYKGIDLLIEGFSEYCKINKNAFLIIGAGKHPKLKNNAEYQKEYERIKNKAENLIPKNMHNWTGFIEEKKIPFYYSASDVSVYPYTIAMSTSGPMAIAVGYKKLFLASISFDKVINDKKILFRETPNDLADKLKNFFENKAVFQNEIENLSRKRSWKNTGDGTYRLYSQLFYQKQLKQK